jgi:hypothetical protein
VSTAGSYTPPAPREARASAITDGNGTAVLTWPAGAFAAPPIVTLAVQADAGFRSVRIVANTAAQTTVNVLQAAGVTLLGIGVLATGTPASGVTVHAHATAA